MAKKAIKNEQPQKQQVSNIQSLQVADEIIQKIEIEKSLILQSALRGSNVDDIYKAQTYLQKFSKTTTISQNKTMVIDPMTIQTGLGYQEKPLRFSLAMLRNMGKVPLIKAIIETRISQVCNFCQPQQDKYSTGFLIRPKKKVMGGDGEIKLNKDQEKRINTLTEFILNCGTDEVDKYRHDSFCDFITKWVRDSLTLDQGCIEFINTQGGDLNAFNAVDGATIRIADTYFKQLDDEYKDNNKDKYVNGYLPFYVQIYMNNIVNEYFPWELAMCVRNPQTDIYANGYGRSELEDLMQLVTNILNADQYNANYFKVGSNPKGILRVTGNVNQTRLEEFRMQWQSQMAGVRNAHKLPIIEAEKMDFINTQTSNKDMEYSRYYEFLIKIACACYKIDPAEINFPLGGSSEQKAMFDTSNEARIKHSRDKGLKPLLRFAQVHINKIINRLDENYEFSFVGLEQEDKQQEVEDIIKKVQNLITVNEGRRKLGLSDLKPEDGGDDILNPMIMQKKQQAEMLKQQGGQQSNQYMDSEYGPEQEEENPFQKALQVDLEKILCD